MAVVIFLFLFQRTGNKKHNAPVLKQTESEEPNVTAVDKCVHPQKSGNISSPKKQGQTKCKKRAINEVPTKRTYTKRVSFKVKVMNVCRYWIRNTISDDSVSYDFLTDLVVRYCVFSKFEWTDYWNLNYCRSGNGMYIVDEGHFEIGLTIHERTIWSKHVFSEETESIIYWELNLWQKGWFQMGYVEDKYVKQSADELAFSNMHFAKSNAFEVKDCVKLHTNRKCNIKEEDKFGLQFDLKSKKYTVFYNDELAGTVSDVLPERFYLAVSAQGPGSSLETTLFEAM